MQVKRVSGKGIQVIKTTIDNKPFRGSDWIPTKFPNCYACSLKGSGKTTVLINILHHMMGKNTKIILCSPTASLDPTWKSTIKKLEDSGRSVTVFDGITEDKNNFIDDFLQMAKEDASEDTVEDTVILQRRGGLDINGSTVGGAVTKIVIPAVKVKVIKYDTPEYIIILDDCGNETRNKAVTQLMKTNRHYKTLVLIASQHLNDLQPAAIKQLQYIFLFARFSLDKLEDLYKTLDLSINWDKFLSLYKDATADKYGFLYIGREPEGDKFRKGFNNEYIL